MSILDVWTELLHQPFQNWKVWLRSGANTYRQCFCDVNDTEDVLYLPYIADVTNTQQQ